MLLPLPELEMDSLVDKVILVANHRAPRTPQRRQQLAVPNELVDLQHGSADQASKRTLTLLTLTVASIIPILVRQERVQLERNLPGQVMVRLVFQVLAGDRSWGLAVARRPCFQMKRRWTRTPCGNLKPPTTLPRQIRSMRQSHHHPMTTAHSKSYARLAQTIYRCPAVVLHLNCRGQAHPASRRIYHPRNRVIIVGASW